MRLSKKNLRTFLKTNSANSELNQKPLLFWALEQPKTVKILLNAGANVNINIEVIKGTYVTPITMCKIMQRQLKEMSLVSEKYALSSVYDSMHKTIENLKQTITLLHYFGGVSGHYRNYISINIRE